MAGCSLSVLPSLSTFTVARIEEYISGKQNFRKGESIVACGDVSSLKFDGSTEKGLKYSCFVHSEMTANKNYLVEGAIADDGSLMGICVCKASPDHHNKCKHVAALFLALHFLCLKDEPPPKYILNRKFKVARFAHPGWEINEECRCNLTPQDILQKLLAPPERYNSKPPVLVVKLEEKKRKRIRNAENKGERGHQEEKESEPMGVEGKEKMRDVEEVGISEKKLREECLTKKKKESKSQKKKISKRNTSEEIEYGPPKVKRRVMSYSESLKGLSETEKEKIRIAQLKESLRRK